MLKILGMVLGSGVITSLITAVLTKPLCLVLMRGVMEKIEKLDIEKTINRGNSITRNEIKSSLKKEIANNICYTSLVYGRINKKLNINLSNKQIENLILDIILATAENNFIKMGKNIYITNNERNIQLTINFYTNRIITVDKLNK